MVAPLSTVASVNTKSSAVSVSRPWEPAGLESAPSLPSGLPVLKEKRSACARVARQTAKANVTAVRLARILIVVPPLGDFKPGWSPEVGVPPLKLPFRGRSGAGLCSERKRESRRNLGFSLGSPKLVGVARISLTARTLSCEIQVAAAH